VADLICSRGKELETSRGWVVRGILQSNGELPETLGLLHVRSIRTEEEHPPEKTRGPISLTRPYDSGSTPDQRPRARVRTPVPIHRRSRAMPSIGRFADRTQDLERREP